MNDMRFLRQQDVVDAEKLASLKVTLIGLGSIGSVTGLYLAKMGVCNLTCFDADVVEEHNWSNQLYSEADIGSTKAEAFLNLIKSYGSQSPEVHCERFTNQPLTEVVISAVDSMESRKVIWKAVRKTPEVRLYIDARMGLQTLVTWAVSPLIKPSRVAYSESLCEDSFALQEPCTARTIGYTPLLASSVVCRLVKGYATQEQIPQQVIMDLATFTCMTPGFG